MAITKGYTPFKDKDKNKDPLKAWGVPNAVYRSENYYRLRYQHKGKQHEEYVNASNAKELDNQRSLFVSKINAGVGEKKNSIKDLTFAEWIEQWRTNYADTLALKTQYRYNELLKSRILPTFGNKKLRDITTDEIRSFYNSLRKENTFYSYKYGKKLKKNASKLSEQTILTHHQLLSTVFNRAIEEKKLSENPITRSIRPKVERTDNPKHYNADQIDKMLLALESEQLKYQVAFRIALEGGLRMGETMGLEWQDIDSAKETISVRQSSQNIPGMGTFTKKTKNKFGPRTLKVTPSLITLIAKYKKYQQTENRDKKGILLKKAYPCELVDKLFINKEGNAMYANQLSRQFKRFQKKHDLDELNLHGLRHTCASYLISKGMDVVTVASRLGHSKSSTTLDFYGHAFNKLDQKAAKSFEEDFFSKDKE